MTEEKELAHVDSLAQPAVGATGGQNEAVPTGGREIRRFVLSLLVEVTEGMTTERALDWLDYIRHNLEKVCMGVDDEDEAGMFTVLRVEIPGRNLTVSPAAREAQDSGSVSVVSEGKD